MGGQRRRHWHQHRGLRLGLRGAGAHQGRTDESAHDEWAPHTAVATPVVAVAVVAVVSVVSRVSAWVSAWVNARVSGRPTTVAMTGVSRCGGSQGRS
jgi:hypothetical protein